MAQQIATRPPAPWTAPTATRPVEVTVRLPGSKSMTARALVLSAISTGTSTLFTPLRARDTELMAAGLRAMGKHISTVDDARWVVRHRPALGPFQRAERGPELRGPAHVEVGLAGTVMRFLPPVAGLAEGPVTFDGDSRVRRHPLGPLVEALRTLGLRIDSAPGGSLPLTVHGTGALAGGEVTIDASASSQFVSALLLAAPAFDTGIVVRHVGPPVPSAAHLRMTVQMLRSAGAAVDNSTPDVWVVEPGRLRGRAFQIEPDLSGAAPFLAASLVTAGAVTVPGWPIGTTQPGDQLRTLLARMGGICTFGPDGLTVRGTGALHGLEADLSEVSELTPVLAALAALADSPSRLYGVGYIRAHEADRLSALARELCGLGSQVRVTDDGLEIKPRPLHGGVFETYDDHRMAHAAAVIGLAVAGIELTDVACTSRTLPEFPALWTSMVGRT